MTQTTTDTDVILSDTEIALLNDARSLLEMLAKRSGKRSWHADTGVTSADYGSVRALADTAAHMIFETLNWTNASMIQRLTEDQLYNRANRDRVFAEEQS